MENKIISIACMVYSVYKMSTQYILWYMYVVSHLHCCTDSMFVAMWIFTFNNIRLVCLCALNRIFIGLKSVENGDDNQIYRNTSKLKPFLFLFFYTFSWFPLNWWTFQMKMAYRKLMLFDFTIYSIAKQ